MDRFDNFNDFKAYVEKNVNYSMQLDEYKLYSEEQYQIINNKKVAIYQNSIEWIIRLNKVLKFINYSVTNTLKFIGDGFRIIEDSENKDMYTYYLEDSAYRLMVCWDMYKQLVNEIYEVGFDRDENYSIYKLIKKIKRKKIWNYNKINNIEKYINSKKHKFVRDYLRNSFAHNTDPTSIYIFHDINNNGKISTTDIKRIIPKHPGENLLNIVDDLKVFYDYAKDVNKYILNKLENEMILVQPKFKLRCGVEFNGDIINIKDLKENAYNIAVGCSKIECKSCKHLTKEGEECFCKPKEIRYTRIYEKEKILSLYY